ncbi:hypothetical protein [Corynebacterium sp.]|uniref:hypothetical protein n=1 Tax=unclassified Corynebacterium TaxID=2624378 RepID=UPI0027BB2125|nr:hypothetical protein [Corynebacterium sp.]
MPSFTSFVAGLVAFIMSIFGISAPVDNNKVVDFHPAAAHVENAVPADEAPAATPGEQLTPQQAVERELTLATQELGHEFVSVRFEGTDTAHLMFFETYNPDTDQAAVDRVMKALADNGFTRVDAVA